MNYKPVGNGLPPKHLSRGSYKFDRDQRDRFLESYAKTGLIWVSARAAGVSEECIRRYKKENIEGFADEFIAAQGIYRDTLEAEIHRRAIDGWDEPVVGGKDRDKVVAHIHRYSDRLLEFHAKRHIPDYREKSQLDVAVTGGVIAVPVAVKSDSDWEAEYSEAEQPKTIDADEKPAE